jgi:tetratricopeptide (TPR) repeat protein
MRPLGHTLLATCIVVGLSGGVAHAEAVLGPAEAMEMARVHHAAGQGHYERGEYALALEQFLAAQEAYPMTGFLFNIGQCHRNLGHHEQALSFFRLYLERNPDASNRSVVEELMARSRQSLEQEEAAGGGGRPDGGLGDADVDSGEGGQTGVEPRRPVYRRWWFWTILGTVIVAGASVASGVAFWYDQQEPEQLLPEGSLGVMDWRR